VGIPKDPVGTRPIAIGEPLLKLASTLALRDELVRAQLTAAFGDLQFGCCRKNGAELIVHTVRHFLRQPGSGTRVAVTIDFTNAFNTPSREDMWLATAF
jgi:hypothetical protein